jgi:hypothetical protein
MFYWKVGDRAIVLTDDEEQELLERAGFTSAERVDFRIATAEGNRLQARLGRFLEEYQRTNPREFELEFVKRSGLGPQHLPHLRALVDSYTLTHGRLKWGAPATENWHEQSGSALWLAKRPDVVSLTLLAPVRRWFRREWDVIGQVSFPGAEIERFYGNGSALFIATSRIVIRCGEDYVQVIQTPDDESDMPWLPEV